MIFSTFSQNIIFEFIIFGFSIYILLKVCDYFVDILKEVGKRFNLSSVFIGIILLAFATSLPELVASLVAISHKSSSQIIYSNLIGSNITNISLVFGTFLLFLTLSKKKLKREIKIQKIDKLYFIFSTLFLFLILFFNSNNILNLIFSIIIILAIIFYLINSYKVSKNSKNSQINDLELNPFFKKINNFYLLSFFIFGLLLIILTSNLVINSLTNISSILNIEIHIISILLLALSTSLPELFLSYTLIKKNEFEIGIFNIIGSNIFNIFLILGLTKFLQIVLNKNSILPIDNFILSIVILSILSLIFLIIIKNKKYFNLKISFTIFLGIYLIYILFLIS